MASSRTSSAWRADAREANGRNLKAFFNYKTAAKEAVLVKVGISGTGIEGARKNLAAEIPGWNFDRVHAAAVQQWKELLDTVQVETVRPAHSQYVLRQSLPGLPGAGPLQRRGWQLIAAWTTKTMRGPDSRTTPLSRCGTLTAPSTRLLNLLQPRRVDDMVQSLLAEYQRIGPAHDAHLAALGQ